MPSFLTRQKSPEEWPGPHSRGRTAHWRWFSGGTKAHLFLSSLCSTSHALQPRSSPPDRELVLILIAWVLPAMGSRSLKQNVTRGVYRRTLEVSRAVWQPRLPEGRLEACFLGAGAAPGVGCCPLSHTGSVCKSWGWESSQSRVCVHVPPGHQSVQLWVLPWT